MPNGTHRRGEHAAVWCVPRHDWFLLHVWHGHPEIEIYVDVCTPPKWDEHSVRMVDLDFDVVVWTEAKGGHVELVDEDEFEEHLVSLTYPAALVAGARRAATDLLARAQAGEPPFTLASSMPWLDRLASSS